MNIDDKKIVTNITISVPVQAEKAIDILESNGFEAYAVGGCVRDSILGKKPADWDICTSCTPDRIKEIFSDYKVLETGLKHGTVTVVIDNMHLEITTYRRDASYTDHRHPEQVEYVTNLNDDLSRRDFTINSLAYNKKIGLIDNFGGLNDLKNKIIRCVGNPNTRFEEDALRILRAIRFSSSLGFSVEPKTKKAIFDKAELLEFISNERICDELIKLLIGENVLNVLLEYKEIIFYIIPELRPCDVTPQNTPHHCYNVYEHIAHSVANINPLPHLRTVMLLHDIGKPETLTTDEYGVSHFKTHPAVSEQMAKQILKRLRFSRNDTKYICDLISQHDNRFPANEKSVKRFISKFGEYFFEDYVKIRFADIFAQSDYMRDEKLNIIMNVKIIGEEIISSNLPLTLKDLDINGNDLLKIGFSGSQIGEILNEILNLVMDNKLQNSKNELLDFARKRHKHSC